MWCSELCVWHFASVVYWASLATIFLSLLQLLILIFILKLWVLPFYLNTGENWLKPVLFLADFSPLKRISGKNSRKWRAPSLERNKLLRARRGESENWTAPTPNYTKVSAKWKKKVASRHLGLKIAPHLVKRLRTIRVERTRRLYTSVIIIKLTVVSVSGTLTIYRSTLLELTNIYLEALIK